MVSVLNNRLLNHTIAKKRRRNANYNSEPLDISYANLTKTIVARDFKNSNKIIRKIYRNLLDKNILLLTVESRNKNTLSNLVDRIDKTKVQFDRQVLEVALTTKLSSVIKIIVDHVQDRQLFIDYKDKIQQGILTKKDITNLAEQILSQKDNNSFDKELQDVVLDLYTHVIENNFKKSKISKDFPIKDFMESLEESRYFLKNPRAINFNRLEQSQNNNNFLVLPVYSEGHAFSVVAKKIPNEDKYSLTFVNLGHRPFENFKNNQYKEFIYTKEDALDILKKYSINIRLDYPEKVVSTSQAYKEFSKKALESYHLNVTSRNQKVGNCFVKNVEKGLRYALSLGLSVSEDNSFDPNSLRVTRGNNDKYKVKFLKPLYKEESEPNFNPKLETIVLKKELIDELIKKFPKYENDIQNVWKNYEYNKMKLDKITVNHDIPFNI